MVNLSQTHQLLFSFLTIRSSWCIPTGARFIELGAIKKSQISQGAIWSYPPCSFQHILDNYPGSMISFMWVEPTKYVYDPNKNYVREHHPKLVRAVGSPMYWNIFPRLVYPSWVSSKDVPNILVHGKPGVRTRQFWQIKKTWGPENALLSRIPNGKVTAGQLGRLTVQISSLHSEQPWSRPFGNCRVILPKLSLINGPPTDEPNRSTKCE